MEWHHIKKEKKKEEKKVILGATSSIGMYTDPSYLKVYTEEIFDMYFTLNVCSNILEYIVHCLNETIL